MTWVWHGMYAAATQGDMRDAIHRVAREATEGAFRLADPGCDVEYRSAALSGQLMSISPDEDGMVATWGATHRFCSLILEQSGFHGLLVGGEYEQDAEESPLGFWHYQVWRGGSLQDMFVSVPERYFSMWSPSMRSKVLSPYLEKRGFIRQLAQERELEFIWRGRSAFEGEYEAILPFLKRHMNEVTLREWQALDVPLALAKAPAILAVPFAGTDCDIFTQAVYFDVARGALRLDSLPIGHQERALREAHEQVGSRVRRIEEFAPIVFCWGERGDYRAMFTRFPEVFAWG